MHGFTAISLAEGVAWGWATVVLIEPHHLEARFLVIAVAVSVASASVPAFGPYLPALYCFFLSTATPCVVVSFTAADPVQRAVGPLMVLFIAGVSGLGYTSNRNFKAVVRLRFQAADLAADLQVQKEIADKANLAKSSFLAAASHDLRQPVHALTLFIGALRTVAMPKEGRRLMEQIEASAGAMDMLFAALLDISRLDAGVVGVPTGLRPAAAAGPRAARPPAGGGGEGRGAGLPAHGRAGGDRPDAGGAHPAQPGLQRRPLYAVRPGAGRLPPLARLQDRGLGYRTWHRPRQPGEGIRGVLPAREPRARPDQGPRPRDRQAPERAAGKRVGPALPTRPRRLLQLQPHPAPRLGPRDAAGPDQRRL